ncbi:MAG: ZPR1 zinc-finger domain protein [Promethearchaeota archaeon]|nr:MAG: ZPR1 zinc-finger domain protein [Candidatus Lokiarchaeota archaeon]
MSTNTIKCPSCKDGIINLSKTTYDLPDGDKLLLIKLECNECEFINKDVIPLTTRIEPGISEYYVTEENDLKSKLYRSPTAKLEIPELEVSVEPGPAAPFYFTNIEGVLARFERAVMVHRNSLDAENQDTKEMDEILDNIKEAYLGNFTFTLRIIDSNGGSYIIPKDESKYNFIKLSS